MTESECEADLIERANAECDGLRAAGHKAEPRRMAQGVEIRITRQGWQGPEVSYLIVTPKRGA